MNHQSLFDEKIGFVPLPVEESSTAASIYESDAHWRGDASPKYCPGPARAHSIELRSHYEDMIQILLHLLPVFFLLVA